MVLYADDKILMATSEDELHLLPPKPYSKKIQNNYIKYKNKINVNVGKPHTEGKNCEKRLYY